VKPQVLPPNVLRHFYAGGARIAALRGVELESDHMPEWGFERFETSR
jgi:mannose-6-phosphate isomerase